jgi:hypothetical protein
VLPREKGSVETAVRYLKKNASKNASGRSRGAFRRSASLRANTPTGGKGLQPRPHGSGGFFVEARLEEERRTRQLPPQPSDRSAGRTVRVPLDA